MSSSVPERRGRGLPKNWIEAGEWPHSEVWKEDAPPSAKLAQGIAARLNDALKYDKKYDPARISARKAAEAAGLANATVTAILKGEVWPDIDTVARIETALGVTLWGDEHRVPGGRKRSGPKRPNRRTGDGTPDGGTPGDGPEDAAAEGGYVEYEDGTPDSGDTMYGDESGGGDEFGLGELGGGDEFGLGELGGGDEFGLGELGGGDEFGLGELGGGDEFDLGGQIDEILS